MANKLDFACDGFLGTVLKVSEKIMKRVLKTFRIDAVVSGGIVLDNRRVC